MIQEISEMHLHRTLLYPALLAITITSVLAASMAPDHPSVASNLVLWLRVQSGQTWDSGLHA